jgi:hypothetical protein
MNILDKYKELYKLPGKKCNTLYSSTLMKKKLIASTFQLITFSIIISTTLILQSCEDVIQLDLPNSAPQIVIEGSISNFKDSVKVKITMSTNYFTPTAITPVTNAQVSISDDAGNVYQLAGKPDGTYFIPNLAGVPGRTYTLKVNANRNQYIATSKMPGLVPLDSISIQTDVDKHTNKITPDAIVCYLKDPAGIANFYWVLVYKNDTLFSPDNRFSIYNDSYFDGDYTSIRVGFRRLNMSPVVLHDRFVVQLVNIDQQTYLYFDVLGAVLDQSILSASTPANPPNNLNNGALGYFSAWSISEKTIVVNQSEL